VGMMGRMGMVIEGERKGVLVPTKLLNGVLLSSIQYSRVTVVMYCIRFIKIMCVQMPA
jgi:hypothetical protein